MTTKRFCLALDLVNEPQSIATYIEYHDKIWPEIADSITTSGIRHMEIYRVEDRLFMIIEADPDFSFDKKNELDRQNGKVQEWEMLMDQYQKRLPGTPPGGKWRLMEKIFDLTENV